MSPRPAVSTPLDPAADPFGWLEEVEGDAALTWVRARNDETAASLGGDSAFGGLKQSILEVLDSDDRIPEVSRLGGRYYNFWRDATHERGVWRRTTLDSYRTDAPEWETVLDLDALNAEEGASWVWHGASALRPEPGEPWRRALVSLSPGGSDTDITREFDLIEKRFIPAEEGGFVRPPAKGDLSWVDADTVLVTTDFGEGTMTTSGYPRTIRLWRRGTPLEEAGPVFEGEPADVLVTGWHSRVPGFERTVVQRAITFYTQH
ncbi:MAG: S9 family peptidase, partial [Propionibacteriaceae bacterium]|nr:S9 family peptidase [Propionibacteriaceae bacterium]